MSAALEQSITLHRPAGPARPAGSADAAATPRWTVQAVADLFEVPFAELLLLAPTVHRENFDPTLVSWQRCCPSSPAAARRTAATVRSQSGSTPA